MIRAGFNFKAWKTSISVGLNKIGISLSHELHPEGSDQGILGVPGSPDFPLHPPRGMAFFLVPNDYYLLSEYRKNHKTKKKPKV